MLDDDRGRSFGNPCSDQLTQLADRRLDFLTMRRNSLQNFMRRSRIPVYASAGIYRLQVEGRGIDRIRGRTGVTDGFLG